MSVGYRRELGPFYVASLVAGSMVGSGIFLVSADIARLGGTSTFILGAWGLAAGGPSWSWIAGPWHSATFQLGSVTIGPYDLGLTTARLAGITVIALLTVANSLGSGLGHGS